MRTRLSQDARRAAILSDARHLILSNGFSRTDMAQVQAATGLSRGGLYHHFSSLAQMLDALVAAEIADLARGLDTAEHPVSWLLSAGSSQLGAEAGIVRGMDDDIARRHYLAAIDRAFGRHLAPVLAHLLQDRPLADLVLSVAQEINRRVLLGDWSDGRAAGFAAKALALLIPHLPDDPALAALQNAFERKAAP